MESFGYVPYSNSGALAAMPMPPRLHWGWVLLLSALTRSFFGDVWLLVQANWIVKVTGRTDIRTWAIVNVCKLPVGVVFGLSVGGALAYGNANAQQVRLGLGVLQVLFGIVILVIHLNTVFRMRAVLEEAPIAIPLSGVMTFFFGPIYFQYFLRDWAPMDYSMVMPYPQYTYPNVPPSV